MQIEESKGLISRYILVELDTLRQKYPSQQEKWITLKDKINSWIQQHTGAFTITDYTNSILSSALVECHINLEEYSATNPLLEGGLSIKSLDSIVIAAYLAFVKDKSKEKSYQILSLIEDIDLKQLDGNFFYSLNCMPYRRQALYESIFEKGIYEERGEEWGKAYKSYSYLLALIEHSDIQMFEDISTMPFFQQEIFNFLQYTFSRIAQIAPNMHQHSQAIHLLRTTLFRSNLQITLKLKKMLLSELINLYIKLQKSKDTSREKLLEENEHECLQFYSEEFPKNQFFEQLTKYFPAQYNEITPKIELESCIRLLYDIRFQNWDAKLAEITSPTDLQENYYNYILYNNVGFREHQIRLQRAREKNTLGMAIYSRIPMLKEKKKMLVELFRRKSGKMMFIYYASKIYYKQSKFQKALILGEQFLAISSKIAKLLKYRLHMLLQMSIICLNSKGLIQKSVEFTEDAMCLLDQKQELKTQKRGKIYYYGGVCKSKYADIQNYAIEQKSVYGQAITYLSMAVKMDPTNALYMYYLGRQFAEIGDIEAAMLNIRKSLQVNKDQPLGLAVYALLQTMQGNYSQAHRTVEHAFSYYRKQNNPYAIVLGIIKAEIEIRKATETEILISKYQENCTDEINLGNPILDELGLKQIHEELKADHDEKQHLETLEGPSVLGSYKSLLGEENKLMNESEEETENILYKGLRTYREILLFIDGLDNKNDNANKEIITFNTQKGQKCMGPDTLISYITTATMYIKASLHLNSKSNAQKMLKQISNFKESFDDIQLCEALLKRNEKENNSESLQILQEITIRNKFNIEAVILFAEIMIYERKECQRAHALLHHALTVQPSNPALLNLMGTTLEGLGDEQSAGEMYLRAIKSTTQIAIVPFKLIPRLIIQSKQQFK